MAESTPQPRATWLTSHRTRRLLVVVKSIPVREPGLLGESARLHLWRVCGGPIDEVLPLLALLIDLGFVRRVGNYLRLSRDGRTLQARLGSRAAQDLALALLRAGYFYDQARTLLDLGQLDESGNLTCALRSARSSCGQLVGLLQNWPSVSITPRLQVPAELVAELQAVWALLPPPTAEDGVSAATRKSIGNRGELYSYHYERLRAQVASDIIWVARDDDNLGYDIEDIGTPRRRIEAKASGDLHPRFFMSENEWNKAHYDPDHYEIHFWGGVDLNVRPADEFLRMRNGGFPLVLENLPDRVSAGTVEATPVKWRLTVTV